MRPVARHHRQGSGSPTEEVVLFRPGRHLRLRLGPCGGRIFVSRRLGWARALARFCELPYRLVCGWEKEARVSAVLRRDPRPVPTGWARWFKPTGSRLKGSSSDHELPRGSFAELVALAERAGQSEALPARDIATHLGGLAVGPAARRGGLRPCGGDRRAVHGRICRSAGTPHGPQAVRPANVKRAVTELRDNMLAKSNGGARSPGSGPGTAWLSRAKYPPGPSPPGRWR